jgi:YVTN family beta-propeller protein
VPADAAHGCADPARCSACDPGTTCAGEPSACACVDEPPATTCAGRCGEVANNCGHIVACGDEPIGTTCAGRCGRVTNNCEKVVVCAECPPRVVATVPLGRSPYGIGVDPRGRVVYVSNFISGTVSAVSDETFGVTTFPAGRGAAGVGVNPRTGKVYVANYGTSEEPESTVTEIDSASGATATISVAPNPDGVLVDVDRDRVWINQYGFTGRTVTRIDGATRRVTSIEVAPQPSAMALAVTSNQLFVAHVDGSLTRIDAADTVTSFGSGFRGGGLAFNQKSGILYFARMFAGPSSNALGGKKLTIFAPDLSSVDVGVGLSPASVRVHERLGRVFVTNYQANTVSVVDEAARAVIATIPVGDGPVYVEIDDAHDLVFVTNTASDDVSVIDAVTWEERRVPVGKTPGVLALDPRARRAYVTNFGAEGAVGSLSVISY